MSTSDQQPLQEKGDRVDTPPRKRTCTSFCLVKTLVIIYGIIFFVIGLILLGIGVAVEGMRKEYTTINDALTSPSIIAIVVGIIIIITAFIGIIGALRDNLVALRIFLVIVIIVFILQVIIGIIAFVYREETSEVANRQLQFALENYHENDDLAYGVDAIQRKFDCCGFTSAKDWDKNVDFKCYNGGSMDCGLPASCCINETRGCGVNARAGEISLASLRSKYYTMGCTKIFMRWIEDHLDIVGATALGLAIPQILGIFLVYTLITKVEDRRYLFNYRKRYYPAE